MLIILSLCLVAASVWLLCLKKNRESLYLLGLCIGLTVELTGVMIFIAKKGGISPEVLTFLFFSKQVQTKLQYFLITLNALGYTIAVGRTLFPLFLAKLALHYSMVPQVRENRWLPFCVPMLPALTLVLYIPDLYRTLSNAAAWFPGVMASFTAGWITFYLLASAGLLLYEYCAMSSKICRRQFRQIFVCLLALTGIYYLYYQQEPGQVYRFYEYSFRQNAPAGYLRVNPSLASYLILVAVSTVCFLSGFISLFRLTRGNVREEREGFVLERRFDTARVGASMFVHSMKNQLLSGKVLFKRIHQLYEQPSPDLEKLREYVGALEGLNDTMLCRMEELYSCVKSNAIYMTPVSMEALAENALERFHKKYPHIPVSLNVPADMVILADKVHFSEALYNLLTNGAEAVLSCSGTSPEISLSAYGQRMYAVIEVRDNGPGIAKIQQKKIFEPFYSGKNSNANWGMGLYYVREIIRSHQGFMRIESAPGKGTCMVILLPAYGSGTIHKEETTHE